MASHVVGYVYTRFHCINILFIFHVGKSCLFYNLQPTNPFLTGTFSSPALPLHRPRKDLRAHHLRAAARSAAQGVALHAPGERRGPPASGRGRRETVIVSVQCGEAMKQIAAGRGGKRGFFSNRDEDMVWQGLGADSLVCWMTWKP